MSLRLEALPMKVKKSLVTRLLRENIIVKKKVLENTLACFLAKN